MSKSEMGHVQDNSVLGLAFVFHVEVLPCIDIFCIDHFNFNLLNYSNQLRNIDYLRITLTLGLNIKCGRSNIQHQLAIYYI